MKVFIFILPAVVWFTSEDDVGTAVRRKSEITMWFHTNHRSSDQQMKFKVSYLINFSLFILPEQNSLIYEYHVYVTKQHFLISLPLRKSNFNRSYLKTFCLVGSDLFHDIPSPCYPDVFHLHKINSTTLLSVQLTWFKWQYIWDVLFRRVRKGKNL